jgi:plastocyanin
MTRRRGLAAGAALALGLALTVMAFARPAALVPMAVDAVSSGPGAYAFAPVEVTAPARTAVALTFNNISDAPHTLIFLAPIEAAIEMAVAPGGRASIEVPTPGPGRYRFVCNVHEGMSGTLVVE